MNNFTNCILCTSSNLKSLHYPDSGELVKCQKCAMVFCSEIPSHAQLHEHYSSYAFFSGISETTKKRYNELLDIFEKYRKSNRILDVGCGEGFFLEEAIKRGWQTYGTECVPHYVNICAKKGIDMQEGELNVGTYSPESFDIITSFEVIEHLNYPMQELNNFNRLVRKGGIVYITTPNFNSISRRILGYRWSIFTFPDHLSYFSPKTLDKVLQENQFRKLKMASTGISLHRLSHPLKRTLPDQNSNGEKAKKYIPQDAILQQKIEKNVLLRILKKLINGLLSLSGSGDGLKALYQKK